MASTTVPHPDVHIDQRPWGEFRRYAHNVPSTVKIITVEAHQALSLQRHRHRDELWVALDDGLVAEIDGEVVRPQAGDEVWIPRGTTHRVRAEDRRARFMEVAFGTFDEADIERLEDIYGRG